MRTPDEDLLLAEKAFPFIRVAPGPGKPRATGLTILADRDFGSRLQADSLEIAADYIDVAKIGIGYWRILSEPLLRQKIEADHAAGIKVFLAGDAIEAAFTQGVSAKFYDAARKIGADAVEVSNAQVTMSLADALGPLSLQTKCNTKLGC